MKQFEVLCSTVSSQQNISNRIKINHVCSHEFKNIKSPSISHKAQILNKSWTKSTYFLSF